MSCTSFLKRLACICTETAAVDGVVNKQLNAAQQIATGLTPAHKVLIKKQVKKELAKAKPAPPTLANELHEHLEALHKAITAGHDEVVRALHKIGQAAVHPVVVEHIFKPPEVPAQATDLAAVPAKP
jgi:rRNA-processing protein FCF1